MMDTNTLITILTWRAYGRIERFTGSMESHSEVMLRLAATRHTSETVEPVKVFWWDTDIEPFPVRREHGKEDHVTAI
jgi:hypothetical protein